MLLKSDLNITEVARQTGFSGIHVFSKTFKNLIGVSPSQFLDEMVSREQIEENMSECAEGFMSKTERMGIAALQEQEDRYMWIEGNYRRNLMDMHIDDWNEEFLSKIDVDEYVDALKDAGIQAAMVKGRPHTGLAYYPTKVGRMHKGLKGFDFFGTMVKSAMRTALQSSLILPRFSTTGHMRIIRNGAYYRGWQKYA